MMNSVKCTFIDGLCNCMDQYKETIQTASINAPSEKYNSCVNPEIIKADNNSEKYIF